MLTEKDRSDRFLPYLLPAIVLVTLAVFSPALWHDFVNYDDPAFIYLNPNIQAGLTWEALRWAFTSGHEANWIPLTWITHMLDVQLFGLNPAGHHAGNLLLHAGSSSLLFLFLKRATGAPWRSFAVALLFALHPLRVESVAWAAERKDVLSAFFWMLTLNVYARYVAHPTVRSYVATLACFGLGLLAKPMLVTLPLILLLLDWWPLGRCPTLPGGRTGHCQGWWRLAVEKVPFVLLAVGSSIITYFAQSVAGEVTQGYTLLSRLGKAGIAYVAYLGKMVWPVDLAPLYPFSKYPPATTAMIGAAVALLLVTVVVWRYRQQQPYLLAGWCWYLVALLPVIGLIQIGQHSIADRYTYIPLTGVFICIVWGVPRLLAPWRLRNQVLGVVFSLVVAVMIVLTSMQLRHWKNSVALFTHTIAVTQGNWVAHNNLGLEYYYAERYDEAISQYQQALQAKPSYTLAYMNLGLAHRAKREYAQAETAFKWALVFEPDNPPARYNLGLLYLDFGKNDLAMREYRVLKAVESPYAEELLRAATFFQNRGTSPR